MRPDTSRWRETHTYDYFDQLAIEGLAWECLRRHEPYQRNYRQVLEEMSVAAPLPLEAQQQWGLRFPRPTGLVRSDAIRPLVSRRRPFRSHAGAGARTSVARGNASA
ncbi:transcriptional regulator domain-containing protein [Rhizorhabdus histidinilytica]|uniref:transcriptional regulator domain-containing protein n=1 Tax=Rhizorhabdus histidinilytica TaxID=439228 RepID=UPI003D2FAD7F